MKHRIRNAAIATCLAVLASATPANAGATVASTGSRGGHVAVTR